MLILLFYFNNISSRLSEKKLLKERLGIEPVLCRTDNTAFTATHRTKSVLSSQSIIVLNYLRFTHKKADGEVVTTFALVA